MFASAAITSTCGYDLVVADPPNWGDGHKMRALSFDWRILPSQLLYDARAKQEQVVREGRRSSHDKFLGRSGKGEARVMRRLVKILGIDVVLYPVGRLRNPPVTSSMEVCVTPTNARSTL